MPVQPPTNAPRSASIESTAQVQSPEQSSSYFKGQGPPAPHQPSEGVRVEVSLAGREALVRSEIAERTLGAIEEELGLAKEALEETGRDEFLESIRTPNDVSAESTAERVYEGIQSYIFDAFQLEHPNPNRERLEEFASASARGLDRGFRDAASLLIALGARQSQLAEERAMTFERVQTKVVDFAQDQLTKAEEGKPQRAELPELVLLGQGESDE